MDRFLALIQPTPQVLVNVNPNWLQLGFGFIAGGLILAGVFRGGDFAGATAIRSGLVLAAIALAWPQLQQLRSQTRPLHWLGIATLLGLVIFAAATRGKLLVWGVVGCVAAYCLAGVIRRWWRA